MIMETGLRAQAQLLAREAGLSNAQEKLGAIPLDRLDKLDDFAISAPAIFY